MSDDEMTITLQWEDAPRIETKRRIEIDHRCGSTGGYNAHMARGEKACNACQAAQQEYDARQRSAPDKVKYNRRRARAQGRAEMMLRRQFPEEYRIYYKQALHQIEQEEGPL